MKKAFTLIELLVVIAIIAILAGMLMPALTQARERARQANCIANQHNVGLFFEMYKGDNDGAWPTGASTAECLGLLYPNYTDTLEIFDCPSDGIGKAYVDGSSVADADYWMDHTDLDPTAHAMRGVYGDQKKGGGSNHPGLMILTCADGHQVKCLQSGTGGSSTFANLDMDFTVDTVTYTDSDVYSDQGDSPDRCDCILTN